MAPDPQIEFIYDGSCRLCRASRRWLERRDRTGRLRFVDSCRRATASGLPLQRGDLDRAAWARLPGGRLVEGFDAVVATLAALPGWRLIAAAGRARPVRVVGRVVYRVIARHRHLARPRS